MRDCGSRSWLVLAVASAALCATVAVGGEERGERPRPVAQTGHAERIFAVAFASRNDRVLVLTASWDGTVRLWDTDTGWELNRLAVDSQKNTPGAFFLDGRRALTYGDDRRARV